MYLCTSGSNRDIISYFPIYMKHCTVSQANNDDHTLYSAPPVVVVAGIRITEALRYFIIEPPIIMFFELETLDFAC